MMNKSENIEHLAVALAKAHAELKNPGFDTTNPFFKNKYASLAAVRDAVAPVLAKQGLSVVQLLGQKESGITCETALLHSSGQWIAETLYMPSAKQDAQGFGSAITYARRYALMAICGVVGDEDDDGAGSAKMADGMFADFETTIESSIDAEKLAVLWTTIVTECKKTPKDLDSYNSLKAKIAAKGKQLKGKK
jgi:hypothetical protein